MENQLKEYLVKSGALSLNSKEFAHYMDENDPLSKFRNDFEIPNLKTITKSESIEKCIYLCGNSLGLQSKLSKKYIDVELKEWAESGVLGWFTGYNKNTPWIDMEEQAKLHLSKIVGCKPIEVAVTSSLTANLNSLLIAFYKPTSTRNKILIEAKAFPSDRYVIECQIRNHGFVPETSLIALAPRDGQETLRPSDILDCIERYGHEIALVCFSGVQYYTGQLFPIETITKAAQAKGCIVGWDLAHAVGNVILNLHDWGIDFAVWCTYKYLNSGPGGIGALFLHEKHAYEDNFKRLAGWWSVDKKTRFLMEDRFVPRPGASGFIQSTSSILLLASLLGSLEIFSQTTVESLREKSILLSGYLEYLIVTEIPMLRIVTPSDSEQRGAQLSIHVPEGLLDLITQELLDRGVICDERKPNCIRLAPVPLYNSFADVRKCVTILKEIMLKFRQKK